ncbi:RTA1-domain-containing protein [Hyaloscypha variabilis F]|uniref:RTA1-domain-containing protein n=1 Tax=Hyaloscypha variabilis (strain UAMH 11265 / GT02V1 / F) TaxID=1149755 RepID=A0A2J6S2T1_HYAVF|nr:RTA1-domain-containing protein [Hyaloscypha variabilis F]
MSHSNLTGTDGRGKWYGNLTLILDPELCTVKTCDLSLASFLYIPSLPGNAIYTAIFALYIAAQLFLGIKYKTWGYMTAMVLGLALEVFGYVARIMLHNDPFNNNDFLMYLVALTIAPALLSASIYLCLSRIVVVYGETLSRFRPRTYTIVFCTCDFICLVLQALGGAIASTANTESSSNLGKNLMLAGLIFQDVSLALFAIACTDFFLRVRKSRGNWNARYLDITNSRLFKVFLFGLMTATITIFIRSSYRIVELSGGFDSNLFKSDEAVFMIFEGFMIVIATSCLTLLHPAVCFQGAFASANFSFRVKKNVNDSSMNSDQESQHSGVPLSMMGPSSREYVALSK